MSKPSGKDGGFVLEHNLPFYKYLNNLSTRFESTKGQSAVTLKIYFDLNFLLAI